MTVVRSTERIVRPTKKQLLEEKLLALSMKLGPSAQLPSFRELCRSFEVSKTTLDGALMELEQRHVIERRHGKGMYVSLSAGQRTIGVVLGSDIFAPAYSPYWRLLLQATREQLGADGQRFNAYFDLPQGSEAFAAHQQLEEDLQSRRLSGLLLIARHSQEEVDWLRNWDIPLVVLPASRAWGIAGGPHYAPGARALAKHGCTRVAWVGFCQEAERQEISQALDGAALPSDPSLFWTPDLIGAPYGDREELGQLMIEHLWPKSHHPVDGLLLGDDTIARGAVTVLEHQGIKVGKDVLIATTANKGSPVLESLASKLILFEQDPLLQARAALDMLGTLINKERPPEPVKIVPPTMRIGADVADIRHARPPAKHAHTRQ